MMFSHLAYRSCTNIHEWVYTQACYQLLQAGIRELQKVYQAVDLYICFIPPSETNNAFLKGYGHLVLYFNAPRIKREPINWQVIWSDVEDFTVLAGAIPIKPLDIEKQGTNWRINDLS